MTNKTEFVVILDYKGIVSGSASAIERHMRYGKTLSSMSNGNTQLLIVGIFRSESLISDFRNLEIIRLPNYSKFHPVFVALSVKALWRYRRKIKIIVSGDPWQTLAVAKVIRFFLNSKINLQAQLHGDFFSAAWKGLSSRNALASLVLPLLLKNCESIRVVSSSQVQDLVDTCNFESNRIVCVPLPLNVARIPNNNPRQKGMPIAIVGRIEEERGLKNLLRLVELIPDFFASRTLWISGDGSRRDSLEKELSRLLPTKVFTFKGELDADQLMNMWASVGTLLSLAPAESYGLAMREAIVSGVPVLAIRSAGSMALHQFIQGDGLSIIEEPFDGERIIQQLSELDNVQISESTREALFSESSKFVELLCSSWLKGH
jgi:glycosyltransferase involved in cell wall biosynthesis